MNYVDELEKGVVANPLRYESVTAEPEEWSNIPKLVARYCIGLEQALAALIKYNDSRSGEETTLSLREYFAGEIGVSYIFLFLSSILIQRADNTFKDYERLTTSRIDTLNVKRVDMNGFIERVDKDLSLFKNYMDDLKKDTVGQLFAKASKDDCLNDNEQAYENDVKDYRAMRRTAGADVLKFDIPTEYSVGDGQTLKLPPAGAEPALQKQETTAGKKAKGPPKWTKPLVPTFLPTATENPLKKARTFSFEQLYDFNNLVLNKSFLRKRVRSLEEDMQKAQEDVKGLQAWRLDMEERTAENFRRVDARFEANDLRHKKFLQQTDRDAQAVNDRITNNDAQISNIIATNDEQDQSLEDLRGVTDQL